MLHPEQHLGLPSPSSSLSVSVSDGGRSCLLLERVRPVLVFVHNWTIPGNSCSICSITAAGYSGGGIVIVLRPTVIPDSSTSDSMSICSWRSRRLRSSLSECSLTRWKV